MNKKIIVKSVDELSEMEYRRLQSELNTIGGFDFVIETQRTKTTEIKQDVKPKMPEEDTL